MAKLNEETKKDFREASPEQKLQILRHEMMASLGTIHSVERVLRKMDLATKDSPERLDFLLDQLANATDHLKEVLDVLTDG